MRRQIASWANVVSLGLFRRNRRRAVPGPRFRRVGLEDLEKRLVLSWPAAPLTGGDYAADIFVNQDGDAAIDAHSIDFDGDVDGFEVFFDDSGSLTFETSGSTDTMVAFYDGPGAPDLEDDDGGSGLNGRLSTGISNWTLLTLGAKGFGSTTGPYGLNVDGPAYVGMSTITIDGSRLGSASGNIGDEYDYDFFRFTTSTAGDWTVTVDPDTSWDPMLLVFDTAGNPVGGGFSSPIDSGGNGSSEQWTGNDLAGGETFFIRIDGYEASEGNFTLDVQGASGGDPNDQISEAYATSLGNTVTGFRISPGEDVDMFEFPVSPGDIVSFDIDRPSGSGLDSWIRLFNGSGTQLDYNDDGAAPGESSGAGSYLEYTFASGGTYYLGVSGYRNNAYNPISGTGDVSGDTGEYTLTLTKLDPDLNDEIDEAHAVNIGDTVTDYYISPGKDVDMFEFAVTAGQRIGFDIDRPLGSILDSWIRLFNGSGTELDYNDDGAAPGEWDSWGSYLEYTFASAGTYYLGVSGYRNRAYDPITGAGDISGDTGEYTLTLTDRTWHDSNDQISEAESLSVGDVGTGSINRAEDVDMWGFTVSAGQVVAFDVDRPLLSSLDSWIRLFGVSGTQLAYNDDGAAPGESSSHESYLEYTFAGGGTYYLGISGYRNNSYSATTGGGDVAGSTGDYSLTLTDLSADTDPNDEISEAVAISIGSSLNYGIDPDEDVDMFEFTVSAGQSVGFDIDRRSGSSLDSWIRLFDGGGTQLDDNDDGAAPGESSGLESYLEYTFAGAGTYYLGVSGYRNNAYDPVTGTGDTAGSTGEYTVSLTDVGSSADPNDQISEAYSTSVGSGVTNFNIDPDDDVDMFEFAVSAGQTVALDIDRAAGSNLDSWIRLFNAGGTQLAYNDDAAAPGEASSAESYLEYTFSSGGTYYLGVSGYRNNAYSAVTGTGDVAGRTGTYDLSLTDLTAADDDAYEDNDSKSIVDGRPVGGANSPNFGLLTGRTQIGSLAVQDTADWFKFRTDRAGTAADVVRIEFDHSSGDLDMVVYRSDGTSVVGSSTSGNDEEEVSLAGEAAGTFYVRVYGYRGATNPNYSLTIDPPSATGTGPQNYAVLISGGADRHNNHLRYYNNIRDLYNVVVTDYSLPRDHIYVLYADGTNPAVDLSDGTNSNMSYAAGSTVLSATLANLRTVMTTLASTVDNDDRFLFYSFDHGNGTFDQSATTGEEGLNAWGENIRDDQLAPMLRSINAGGATYVFAQCFAGGMLDDLGTLAANEFGMAATNHYEYSWGDGFAAAFVDALDNNYIDTHDAYAQTRSNDPFLAPGTYPDNGGTVGDQIEHPWSSGADFSIFHTSNNASPGLLSNYVGGVPTIDTFESVPSSPFPVGTVAELTVTASDPDFGDTVEKITFYLDANMDGAAEDVEIIDTDSNGADGWSTTWDTKSVAPGTVSLLAVAEDSTQLRGSPGQLVVTLTTSGNQPPVVDTFLTDPPSPITVGQNVTLTAVANDPDAGDAVAKVAFYDDENSDGFGQAAELIGVDSDGTDGWRFDWDTKLHATGNVTLLAVAEDENGLRGNPHLLPLLLVSQGDQPPTVDNLSANPPSPITVGEVVQLTAEASDPDAGDAVSKVSFYRDANTDGVPSAGELIGVDSDGSDGWHLDWDTKGLTPGSVSLLAVAESPNLQESSPRSLAVVLAAPTANQPPTVTSFTTDPAPPISPGQSVTLQVTATDPDPGDTIVQVAFFEDVNGNGTGDVGQGINELLGTDNNGADGWSFNWDTTGHSPAPLLAVVYDTSNAASDPAVAFAIGVLLVPHVPANQPASVVIRRDVDDVVVLDLATTDELFRQSLATVPSILIQGSDAAGDTVIVDVMSGGPFTLPDGIHFHGGADNADHLSFIAPDGDATYRLDDDVLLTPGMAIGHHGVEQFEITDGGGDDTYELLPTDKHIILNDSGGTDELDFSNATSRIVLNLGLSAGQTQTVQGGNNTLALTGLLENVTGTPGHDSILGNTQNNVFIGSAGNDVLIGQGGHDTLDGGEGNDSIYSGPGKDIARGGPGDDRMWGGGGTDEIDAGSGDDRVRAGGKDDIVRGGEDNDVLRGGNGNDIMLGGDGVDLVHGGLGRDVLLGGPGNDTVEGSVHADILIGSRTTHDTNNAALLAILAEWSRTTSIDDRINNLENGGGLNGTVTLDDGALLGDSAHDQLYGSFSPDWFIQFGEDTLQSGEPTSQDRVTMM